MRSDARYANIPQELKERRQWVCYRVQEREGKRTKIPYRTDKVGRVHAKTNDPATWHTFEEVVEAVGKPKNRFDGIGFVLSETDPYIFIDLDHVVNRGAIEEWAKGIIERVGSYTEFSQSGTGIHIIARAKKPGPRCRTHKHPKFEIYDSARLVVFTGKLIAASQAQITDDQKAVEEVYFGVFGENGPNVPQKETTKNTEPVGMSDLALIEKAKSAANGDKFTRLWDGNTGDYNGDESAADMALCCMLAFWTQNDPVRIVKLFRQSGLMRPKWDEKRGDRTYGEMTVEAAIRSATDVYHPGRDGDQASAVCAEVRESRSGDFPLTDLGNAERFIALHGSDVRFNVDSGRWLVWNGKHWETDHLGEVHRLAREVVRSMHDLLKDAGSQAERDALYSHIKRSESAPRLEAMVQLARYCEGIPIQASNLDADPLLLNCRNRTLNLRSGDIQPHRREDLITKIVPVEYLPHAECSRWKRFLGEIFQEDTELIQFVQKSVGYSLTGDTSEQCFFVLHGCGSNGKTVFLRTIQDLTGDYSMGTHTDALMEKHGDSIPNDLARLKGARLVTASETKAGRRLAEGLLKQAAGEDLITARFLRQEFFDFKPEFKIWLACNHLPRIDGQDYGIWRRIKLIPFRVVFRDASSPEGPYRDAKLISKLGEEFPGILRWAVEGCLLWQREGLEAPGTIRSTTGDYQSAMDILGGFLSDRCVTERDTRVTAKELYAAYQGWCEENGEKPESQRTFGMRLGERGQYQQKRGSKGRREWHGIGLVGGEDCVSGGSGDGNHSGVTDVT